MIGSPLFQNQLLYLGRVFVDLQWIGALNVILYVLANAYHRILKLARTIADLVGS